MSKFITLTPEEARMAMLKQIQEQGAQYIDEVAMPGVELPVQESADDSKQ